MVLAGTHKAYTPKLPRWQHQDRALGVARGRRGFAYFMEMRTGKTKVTLDEFGELELAGTVKHLLVVAPAGVYRTWAGDAAKHLGDDLRRRCKLLIWDSKLSPPKREELAQEILRPQPKIFLVNIEALSTVEYVQKLCAKFIRSAPTMMVIDESTTIKSYKANRTKFCLAAAQHCKVRRILSGLPSPQSPLDLFTQFAFLDPVILGDNRNTLRSQYLKFQDRYAIVVKQPYGPGGRYIDVIQGYRNLTELKSRIDPHSFRVLLKDCTDLPEKIYMRRDVALTPEQKTLYNAMVTKASAIIEAEGRKVGRVSSKIVLDQLLKLQQIVAGHAVTEDQQMIDLPENKTGELLAALNECAGKAIIWATFDTDVRKISAKLEEVYGKGSVARFWGGNANTREAEEREFKTNPKCRFMVATAAAGGRGRTWDVADLVVYYANTFSLEHRAQSEERTQAVGKKTNTLYLDLVCPGTVEEKVLMALRGKRELSNAVTGDNFREWVK